MAGTTKTVGTLILAFWLIGAVITTVVDEFQRKHACIQDEGVLKGLFWCKTDQVDRSGLEHTKSLLYGLNWPIQLFGNAKPARNSTSASEEDHRLEKLAREMEECGIEVAPISATQKKCLMSKEVVLEGKKTLLEAMCEREARSYESFAKLRDAGVSRDKVLEWVDTRTPELARKMSSVLDESRQGELIEHVKEDVRRSVLYVYSHPDRTALEIRRERLLACLTSERHEMVKSQVSRREEGNANSPTNKPETAAEAFFVVQLAALSDPVKANELKERVMRAGIPAFTDRVGRLTRVRVGPYESREAALIASAQLAKIGINGIVFEGTSSSLAFLPLTAVALTPGQVFEKVRSSVIIIKTLDANGNQYTQGSGLVLPSKKIVTNCHVLKGGAFFLAGSRKDYVPTKLIAGDEEMDLCLLQVDVDFLARKYKKTSLKSDTVESLVDLEMAAAGIYDPVEIGKASTLKVGDAVYAVGAPRGLELSISDGIVSALRGDSPPLIQTTAAISRGSSGGGLFDVKGRLVGITTLYLKDSQNLNFAMPIEWLENLKSLDSINSEQQTKSE